MVIAFVHEAKVAYANINAGWQHIIDASELPLMDLDKMKYANITRLLCKFIRPFAPQDVPTAAMALPKARLQVGFPFPKPRSQSNPIVRTTKTTSLSSEQPKDSITARDAMPERKQRRERDRDAIDDNVDDIEKDVRPKTRSDEESLIEFLPKNSPQPSMTTQPVVAAEITPHPVATSHPCVDGRLLTHTSLTSLESESPLDTQMNSSIQGLGDEEGSSPQDISSEGDCNSDSSIFDCRKRHILESIMEEFNTIFFSCASGSSRGQTDGSEPGSSSNTGKQPGSSAQQSQTCSSIRAGKKRAGERDPSSEGEDDGNQKRHKNSLLTSSATGRPRLLACPFNKHDPNIYSPCNEDKDLAYKFRCCGGPGWPTVARLKYVFMAKLYSELCS
jgi:hypothetical protein